MKKIIIALVCSFALFTSCKKEDTSVAGSVAFTDTTHMFGVFDTFDSRREKHKFAEISFEKVSDTESSIYCKALNDDGSVWLEIKVPRVSLERYGPNRVYVTSSVSEYPPAFVVYQGIEYPCMVDAVGHIEIGGEPYYQAMISIIGWVGTKGVELYITPGTWIFE